MDTDNWPHEKIRSVALRYIRDHAVKEAEWRFTSLDALAERLARIVTIGAPERTVVSSFIDGLNWHAMTTSPDLWSPAGGLSSVAHRLMCDEVALG